MRKFKHKITQDVIILENNSHGAHIAFLGDQIIPRRFIENFESSVCLPQVGKPKVRMV